MFKWFKKKKVKKQIKIPVVKHREPKDYQLGFTEVKLTFSDNRKFTTYIYGTISQYVSCYYDSCAPMLIKNSYICAQEFITAGFSSPSTYLDDPKSPNEASFGQVVHAEIGNTEEEGYSESFSEAYVEEVIKEVEVSE
jgi:hypothetical protein